MHKALRFAASAAIVLSSFIPFRAQAGTPGGQGIHLDEVSIGTGFAYGDMKRTDGQYKAIPAFVRIGFDADSLFGLEGSPGTLQLAFEPFVNPILEPEAGVEAGIDLFVRYKQPVSDSVKLIPEIGFGPCWLSIDTLEQGDAGFNFLGQAGLAAQVGLTDESAITFGYRFRHISNGGTREHNTGMNQHALVATYDFLF